MKYTILYAAIASATLHSCSTTNKTKTSNKTESVQETRTKTDSAAISKLDTASVKKSNILTTVETEGEYTKETTITFADVIARQDDSNDTALYVPRQYDNSPIDSAYLTPAEDYFTTVSPTGEVTTNRPIKSIATKERGAKKETRKTEEARSDSAHKIETKDINVNRDVGNKSKIKTEDKSKKVFRIDSTGLVVGSIILLILAAVVYYYRKRIKLALVAWKIIKPKVLNHG